ncbi:MAG TPA: hypothetical protein VIS31_07365 [Woeseiaceae bacterium]
MTIRKIPLFLTSMLLLGLVACGDDGPSAGAEQAAADKAAGSETTKPQATFEAPVGKPGAPFAISYAIIGTPIVGSPVTIDLRVTSMLGPQPVRLSFIINDATAMMLHEAQPSEIRLEAPADRAFVEQRVTVVPIREGRLYLNVSAAVDTEAGTSSTVIAIPVQVGEGARDLEEHGRLETDEEGETVRILESE